MPVRFPDMSGPQADFSPVLTMGQGESKGVSGFAVRMIESDKWSGHDVG